ncbi:hypothetical protein AVEN_267407-1, partial [Araneus ventricosus]
NIRLIQDFIVPALDEETYGDLLAWDSEPGVFKIKWTHKARSSWTEEDSRVFIDIIGCAAEPGPGQSTDIQTPHTNANPLLEL